MFEKNDKQLLTIRTIINVVTILFVIIGIICSIILLVNKEIFLGVFLLVFIPFFSWFMWIIWRLIMTFLCDIKLIRNKLYGVENDNMKVFLGERQTPEQIAEQKRVAAQNAEKIERLKYLRDASVITEKEFQQAREKLLK